ncbi:hypothetical protein N665_0198s0259 [Sinapis alba]|nr:hypothetical protein N665_0198s0259 [Sinapis alba]
MEGAKRTPLSARKKPMRKSRRLVKSIVSYLKSDAYLYAPLFSSFSPLPPPPPSNVELLSKAEDLPVGGSEALRIERVKNHNKRRMSEKVKGYLKSDSYMYTPMNSPLKSCSSLKGKLQLTNLVMMEVSKSCTSMKEDHMNLSSDIAERTLHNGTINSPKRSLVILEGQRTGLSRETEEKTVKPDPRRVPIE